MKITSISYRCLRTGPGYNNTAVEAHATLDEGEAPERALADLRFWVDKQVDDTLKLTSAYEKLSDVQAQIGYAQKEAERYEARTKAARQFITDCRDLADLAREHGKGGLALSLENLL